MELNTTLKDDKCELDRPLKRPSVPLKKIDKQSSFTLKAVLHWSARHNFLFIIMILCLLIGSTNGQGGGGSGSSGSSGYRSKTFEGKLRK